MRTYNGTKSSVDKEWKMMRFKILRCIAILLSIGPLVIRAQIRPVDWNSIDIDNDQACDPNKGSLLIREKTIGRITAPSPGKSHQNRICSWTLLAPDGHQVWLKVIQLRLDVECIGKLEIFDGHSSNGSVIERFAGSLENIPLDKNPIISPRNVIHISYTGVVVGSQRLKFLIEYIFLKKPKNCPPSSLPCRHNSNDSYGPFFHFNTQCYTPDQVCDGIDDCGDGTDEQSCSFDGVQIVPKPVQSLTCGTPKEAVRTTRRRAKIRGGRPAVEGSWPWMAALVQGYMGPVRGLVCGGVLINAQWLLSAAHCFDRHHSKDPRWTIHLGLHTKYSTNSTSEAIRYIEGEPFRHKEWLERDNPGSDSKYDIALIKLNAPIPSGNHRIAPICLPTADEKLEPRGLIAGWGDTKEKDWQNVLKQGSVPIWNVESCQKRYNETERDLDIDETLICAGQIQNGDDTCIGDSGGPLITMNTESKRWEVIGITSQGYDGNCEEGPTLYTSVPVLSPWINDIINRYQ